MGKNTIYLNSGRPKFTKYNPDTGALSTDPKDIRICTETISKITKKKSVDTYDLPDGNSNYPAGTYEKGVKYDVDIEFSNMSSETLAFINNAELEIISGTMHDIKETSVPSVSPFEVALLGNVNGDPMILDSTNRKFTKVATSPISGQFSVTAGTTGTRQAMSLPVSTKASTAGTATVTVTAAGKTELVSGKAVTVNLTTVDVNTNASEIRSALAADPIITSYFDIGGTNANVLLTKKKAESNESMSVVFALGTALGAAVGAVVPTVGVADIPAKVSFSAADAGITVFIDYNFDASAIEHWSVPKNVVLPVIQLEIVHDGLSADKTKQYRFNETISKMTIKGDYTDELNNEHKPNTISFSAIKPAGQNVVDHKKIEVPVNS